MSGIGTADQRRLDLFTAVATPGQKKLAAAIAIVALLAFVAALPFVRVPLVRMPAFIPSYQAALFFIDLITAVLLYEQFVRLRSPAVLALAAGYLFDAFLIVPHTLTFPGAFAPGGLLGAQMQTTAWLYVFWHGGFPMFVMAYALLRRREAAGTVPPVEQPAPAIAISVAVVAALALALAALATAGHDWLPVVMQGSDYSLLVSKGVSPVVWALTLVAMLSLWQPPLRVVDLWLMLVMWVWLFDIGLAAVFGSSRFDLGFYAGRIFGLIAASFLLVTLLVEMAHLYAQALAAAADAEKRLTGPMPARARSGILAVSSEQREAFVVRQNIRRYQEMLDDPQLPAGERGAVEALLAEEEAKLTSAVPLRAEDRSGSGRRGQG